MQKKVCTHHHRTNVRQNIKTVMGGDGGVIAVKRKFIKECKTEEKVIFINK
jgi:hypothetical protein